MSGKNLTWNNWYECFGVPAHECFLPMWLVFFFVPQICADLRAAGTSHKKQSVSNKKRHSCKKTTDVSGQYFMLHLCGCPSSVFVFCMQFTLFGARVCLCSTVPVAARSLCSMFDVYQVYKDNQPKLEYEGSKFKLPLPPGQTVQPKPKPIVDKHGEEWGPRIDMTHKYPYEQEREQRIDMLRRVHIQEWWDGGLLDPSWCACPNCEYSSGDLMGQRYSLMRRLYQVNAALFGRNTNKHIPELELLRTLIWFNINHSFISRLLIYFMYNNITLYFELVIWCTINIHLSTLYSYYMYTYCTPRYDSNSL